jgi:membrane-bound metal-dependent hydrolase YbcI (DUF457 family)
MTPATHLLFGLAIGVATGNPLVAVATSVLVDVDHIYSWGKHRVLWPPKTLYKVVTSTKSEFGDERNYLHNIFVAGALSGLAFLVFGPFFGISFMLGYFGHLFLDALDQGDYWPLYPYKGITIRGLIPYCSEGEFIFGSSVATLLLFVWFGM